MSLPFISAVMVTFGRPEHVNEALACFLDQDYEGPHELVIFNTYPKMKFLGEFPNVRIINCTERPPCLGEARNLAIAEARGDVIVTFDDDDRYLKIHLSNFGKHFTEDVDWVWHNRQFYMEGIQIKQIVHGSVNVFAYRKSLWESCGKYDQVNSGEDRMFLTRAVAKSKGVKVELADNELSLLYCWANGVYHVSGLGDDKPGQPTGHQRIEADLENRVRGGAVPIGDILLRPKKQMDYDALARKCVEHRNSHALKKNSTVVVQLGRYGDLVNILPICLHIHNAYAKPHLMVSREFTSLLDGVSYVTPYVVDLQHTEINEALEIARREFKHVICTQVWGRNFQAEKLTPSYNMESWRVAGFLNKFNDPTWRPLFDRRDPERDAGLVRKLDRNGKPFLIVNVTRSVSSPFDGTAILTELVRTLGEQFQVIDVSSLRLDHIYDLIGLMERPGSVVCSIDTALIHLAAVCSVPLVAITNPVPWLGSTPRVPSFAQFTYETAKPSTVVLEISEATRHPVSPEALNWIMKPANAVPRSIYHACERHGSFDAREERRKSMARATWEVLYSQHGVIPAHLSAWFRSAKAIGDPRDLPYLKDVLGFAMKNAGDDDVIMLTNDDLWLHPDLPDVLKFHVSLYGACASFRCEFDGQPEMKNNRYVSMSNSVGQDVFAFTKHWLTEHWQEIPDFIVGASEWDWCLTAIIRQSLGIQTTTENIRTPIWPAEIETGYVAHQAHRPAWIHPDNVHAAPSQAHNQRLFSEWASMNMPEFRLNVYPGRPAMRRAANGKEIISIRRTSSLGDVLAATCVADALLDKGYEIEFQSHSSTHCLLRRRKRQIPVTIPNGNVDVNLDGAYENDPHRSKKHFAEMFIGAANAQLAHRNTRIEQVANFAPRIFSDPGVMQQVAPILSGHSKPWVMICPSSYSFVNRTVPGRVWQEAAPMIHGTKFWLGRDAAPAGIVDLHCRHVDLLIEYLAAADLLITVDTGPLHIAAALGTPCVAINQSSSPECHLSDQRDFIQISPALDCLNCQKDICPINASHPPCHDIKPWLIYDAANARLRQSQTEDVSAVICVYKPKVDRLNKCLAHVLPQVQEVVVVGNLDTPWPVNGVNRDSKIRFVQRRASGIGYSRNANYGARHTNGKYLLFLNDDVFLNPDVVPSLLREMRDGVGAVTHLLRYPQDNTIQYAGKVRVGMGFGHIDHKGHHCRHAAPVEEESLCGASMLVRRKAYFAVDGYSEEYVLYSEDDDFGLKLRRAGWKIIFTPHATGYHEEHCSTNLLGDLTPYLNQSNQMFATKWKTYLETGVFA